MKKPTKDTSHDSQIAGRRGVAKTIAILAEHGYFAFETPVNSPAVDVVAYLPVKPITRSFEVKTSARSRKSWKTAPDWGTKKVDPAPSYYYVFVRFEDESPKSEHFYVVPSQVVTEILIAKKRIRKKQPWVRQDEVAEYEDKWHEAFHTKGLM